MFAGCWLLFAGRLLLCLVRCCGLLCVVWGCLFVVVVAAVCMCVACLMVVVAPCC